MERRGIRPPGQPWLRRVFPDRQVVLRTDSRMRCFTLTTGKQLCAVAAAFAVLAWSLGVTLAYRDRDEAIHKIERQVAEKDLEIEAMKASYRVAFGRLDRVQSLFSDISGEVGEIQANLLALAAADLGEQARAPAARLRLPPGATPAPLADKVDRTALRERVTRLEGALDWLKTSHAEFLKHSADLANGKISRLENTLTDIGLNPEQMIAGYVKRYGRGGPFIPPPAHTLSDAVVQANLTTLTSRIERLDSLTQVMRAPPLGQPLDEFQITSPFGVRADPLNHAAGMHEGVDLGSPVGAQVYSTGDGVVIFAGFKGLYGQTIDIDHGLGMVTRYAHLSAISVNVGDKIRRHAVIGEVGATGRTTGPHLHYEVRIADQPRNPLKFILAGQDVLKE